MHDLLLSFFLNVKLKSNAWFCVGFISVLSDTASEITVRVLLWIDRRNQTVLFPFTLPLMNFSQLLLLLPGEPLHLEPQPRSDF